MNLHLTFALHGNDLWACAASVRPRLPSIKLPNAPTQHLNYYSSRGCLSAIFDMRANQNSKGEMLLCCWHGGRCVHKPLVMQLLKR